MGLVLGVWRVGERTRLRVSWRSLVSGAGRGVWFLVGRVLMRGFGSEWKGIGKLLRG